jgi:hypothetical protein
MRLRLWLLRLRVAAFVFVFVAEFVSKLMAEIAALKVPSCPDKQSSKSAMTAGSYTHTHTYRQQHTNSYKLATTECLTTLIYVVTLKLIIKAYLVLFACAGRFILI